MRTRQAGTVLVVALTLTCAHRPPPPATAIRPAWPPPPAAPRVRWLGAFPDPSRTGAPSASFWSRALDFITGEDPDPQSRQPPLQRPFGLAVWEQNLLIADPDGAQVVRLRWRTGDVEPLACRERAFAMPLGLAVAPDGAVWIADGGAGAIIRRTGDGHCRAFGVGSLGRPSGIAIAQGTAYVVDPPQHAVWRFRLDGTLVDRLGQRGTGAGQLNFPTGIAALPDGSLLVVDALNFRVVHLSADGGTLGAFGEAGDGGGAFARPKAIATDESGRIYVSDAQNDVVLIYRGGAFELAVGGPGAGPGQLTLPAGLAIGDGYLFVADSYNRRVGIFELVGGAR
jgi:DNA-binding beta-propeller fold protein YncE